jgi:hypothetical protein
MKMDKHKMIAPLNLKDNLLSTLLKLASKLAHLKEPQYLQYEFDLRLYLTVQDLGLAH